MSVYVSVLLSVGAAPTGEQNPPAGSNSAGFGSASPSTASKALITAAAWFQTVGKQAKQVAVVAGHQLNHAATSVNSALDKGVQQVCVTSILYTYLFTFSILSAAVRLARALACLSVHLRVFVCAVTDAGSRRYPAQVSDAYSQRMAKQVAAACEQRDSLRLAEETNYSRQRQTLLLEQGAELVAQLLTLTGEKEKEKRS
jgi:hypothetical protein